MQKILCSLLLAFISTHLFAQQTIKGIIRDNETNQPIPGALIVYNNTKIVCSNKGIFEVNIINNNYKITVSSNGYLAKEFTLENKSGVALVFLEPSNLLLNEIQVAGLSTKKKSLNTAGSIGTITPRDFDRNSGIHLQNSLNLIPGVRAEMKTVTAGTRIVIRGYGNQTNTNGIGYKAYLNGIPLTDADGTTILDDVDFDNLGRVEVFKGPSSSIFGTGIGGVVTMFNQKAEQGTSG